MREIDDIIGRWDAHITLMEAGTGAVSEFSDDLEAEFLTKEEESVLRHELDELLRVQP